MVFHNKRKAMRLGNVPKDARARRSPSIEPPSGSSGSSGSSNTRTRTSRSSPPRETPTILHPDHDNNDSNNNNNMMSASRANNHSYSSNSTHSSTTSYTTTRTAQASYPHNSHLNVGIPTTFYPSNSSSMDNNSSSGGSRWATPSRHLENRHIVDSLALLPSPARIAPSSRPVNTRMNESVRTTRDRSAAAAAVDSLLSLSNSSHPVSSSNSKLAFITSADTMIPSFPAAANNIPPAVQCIGVSEDLHYFKNCDLTAVANGFDMINGRWRARGCSGNFSFSFLCFTKELYHLTPCKLASHPIL